MFVCVLCWSIIDYFFVFAWLVSVFRIDPATYHIDFSLRGTDVGGPDPVPPPQRLQTSDRKRSKSESSDKSENEEISKKKIQLDERSYGFPSDSKSDSGKLRLKSY